tara:strand:- start:865 stop:1032 length:168 start_codon:yes stop_codon:yes gene_type:complete
MLETASAGRVLQAKVSYMKVTFFGPKLTEIGTCFFTRLIQTENLLSAKIDIHQRD